MQYWEDMSNKWGFSDGEAYPAGVEIYRNVYVKTVNKLAEKHNSRLRVIPFDRDGIHNFCLWVAVDKNWYEENYNNLHHVKLPDEEVIHDEGFVSAVEEAKELNLDDFVVVEAKLDDNFESFLAEI